MNDLTFKTLGDLWNTRRTDRVGVMNLKEKTPYLLLNHDSRGFETYSAQHGILFLKPNDTESADWIEWPAAEQDLVKH